MQPKPAPHSDPEILNVPGDASYEEDPAFSIPLSDPDVLANSAEHFFATHENEMNGDDTNTRLSPAMLRAIQEQRQRRGKKQNPQNPYRNDFGGITRFPF